MSYIAIDPGTYQSGIVRTLNGVIIEAGTYHNCSVIAMIRNRDTVIVEWLQCYGAAIGQSVLRTAAMCGRVQQRCAHTQSTYHEMTRPDVLRTLVGNTKGVTKAVCNRAVKDLYPATGGGKTPEVGIKHDRGPLWKMKGSGHAWDALALLEAWKRVRVEQ